jgi:hypothetical protein
MSPKSQIYRGYEISWFRADAARWMFNAAPIDQRLGSTNVGVGRSARKTKRQPVRSDGWTSS